MIVVAWNSEAGRARRFASWRRVLELEEGLVVHESRSRTHAAAIARAAAKRGARLVLAAGGDGTVAAVATGLLRAGGRTTLGVLPLGTANDVARMLGLSSDPREALRTQLAGARPRRLDVLDVRHDARRRLVLNVLAAGNGAVVSAVDSGRKRRWGHWSYLRSAADQFSRLSRFRVRLRLDDDPWTSANLLTCVAGNGESSGGGLRVAPGASPWDGLLDVVALPDAPASVIAATALRLVTGSDMRHPPVIAHRGRRLRLTCRSGMPLSADGEDLGDVRRLDVRVMPRALRVVGALASRPGRDAATPRVSLE